IIIKSFIYPLSFIHDGAKAIEQKNFQYKLPTLDRDDCGALGEIFNEVIGDLEELSVAGAIQEQLLPNSEIKTGYFNLYGKSVPMGALGGDYFDFIEMEDNKFSVALGDVAGHGVGASLIMAMAKAGLVSLDSLWKKPQQLILKLHEMVYKSKTQNQKKIMTFQYIYLDGESGQGIYSNAGGCSPFIIRKSKEIVEELKLPGAVLGAFKKGKFSETSIKFDIGDAIVFYTDGIVECKNKSGTVLGYDKLKNLLYKCWNKDAKIFYNNVYNSYLEYIGGNKADAEDDVTIVILVFNKPTEVITHT
ncbi:MAG: SpoIIE family protein phosphatase, partial [Candidatus Riflebacteria bacterium]|nr:SpoIIE family protein phosphatase [Candidatus Riflebacteria bacterium]